MDNYTSLPNRDSELHIQAVDYLTKFRGSESVEYIEKAIVLFKDALSATAPGHPQYSSRVQDLGVGYRERYERVGDKHDLETAVQLFQQALASTHFSHPELHSRLYNLGIAYGHKYYETGDDLDLWNEVDLLQKALSATPPGHPELALRISELATGYSHKYNREGDQADIKKVFQLLQEALDITLPNSPEHAYLLHDLGTAYRDRYTSTSSQNDLKKAIQNFQEALDILPEHHPKQAWFLDSLSITYRHKYYETGAQTHLEQAIQLSQAAINKTPFDHLDRPARVYELGVSYGDRYQLSGAEADLDKAMELLQEVISATPIGHTERAPRLCNLAVEYGDRYYRTKSVADLEKATQLLEEAFSQTPSENPERSSRLYVLSTMYMERYQRSKKKSDIKKTIRVARSALKMTPLSHPFLAYRLHILGMAYIYKYQKTGEIRELRKAIKFSRAALAATPSGHPGRASNLHVLGNGYEYRAHRRGSEADRKKAMKLLYEAVNDYPSSVHERLTAGKALSQYAAESGAWEEAYQAAYASVHLIPLLTPGSIENTDKQHLLSSVVSLASDAAAIALQAGKDPIDAIRLLELGRGVIMGSLYDMRTDVSGLSDKYPLLGEEFLKIRSELDIPLATNLSEFRRSSPLQTRADIRQGLNLKLQELLVEIRQKPGFENFPSDIGEREIHGAARSGPIAIVNCSKYRCDALLVESHRIQPLPLPGVSVEAIEEKERLIGQEDIHIIEWLWEHIASPILDALGFTPPPPNGIWPHVWWIPTGALSRLPLHASGRHFSDSSETVLDRVISSYGTSIKAITHTRRKQNPPILSTQALLVAMNHTPGASSLPFTENEITAIGPVCQTMGLTPTEPDRRKRDVLTQLPHSRIFHFAGHGHTDESDPLRSHLRLQDGLADPLTVADLLDAKLHEHLPFLAYLSACGTGRIKEDKLVDEGIHLVNAFQLAGFRHAIGTLSHVDDALCVDMARITYEGIREGNMSDESVAWGLHNATRVLRDRWVGNITRHGHQYRRTKGTREVRRPRVSGRRKVMEKGKAASFVPPRDIILCDEEDEEEGEAWIGPVHWIPFIHFGV